jgi:cullin 1
LEEFIKKHLEQLFIVSKSFADEAILAFYRQEWNRFGKLAIKVNLMFRYLNRHWIKREIDEGKKGIYDIYTLHIVQWREVFAQRLSGKIMKAILKLTEKERNFCTIGCGQIKWIADSFVSIGMLTSDNDKETEFSFYQENFEKPWLQETRRFYDAEGKKFLSQHGVLEYIEKVEEWLGQEEERARTYLHAKSEGPLKKICCQVLVSARDEVIIEEFRRSLEESREEIMARIYKLLSRVPGGVESLLLRFGHRLRKAGLAAVLSADSDFEKLEAQDYDGMVPSIDDKREGATNEISINGEWICLSGKNTIWLPPDYRATCAALYKNLLILGHRSGRITFLELAI